MSLKGFLSGALQAAGSMLKGKAPTILTGTGLVAGVATVALVAKKAPEAKEKKDEVLKKAAEENYSKPKTVWEVTKAVVPVYKEPIATGVVAAGCIIASDVVVNKRLTQKTKELASATAGYLAVKQQLDNYKEATKEVLGEQKAKDLDRKAVEREVRESGLKEEDAKELKYTNEGDKTLVYDPYVKDYYRSSLPDMLKLVTKLSLKVQGCMDGYIPLTDWYDEIGYKLDPKQRAIYEEWVFVSSVHYQDDCLGFNYTSFLSPNDTPALTIEFDNLIPLWKTREKQRF